jgi:23S rRNA G2445 N2-methylase RlmL
MNEKPVTASEWQHRAELLRVKLAECQAALASTQMVSVLAGLDLAKQHIEAQITTWRNTGVPAEVVLDQLLKNIGALKEHVVHGRLPEKK